MDAIDVAASHSAPPPTFHEDVWEMEQRVEVIAQAVITSLRDYSRRVTKLGVMQVDLPCLPTYPNPPRPEMQRHLNRMVAERVRQLATHRGHLLPGLDSLHIIERKSAGQHGLFGMRLLFHRWYDPWQVVEPYTRKAITDAQRWLYGRSEDEEELRIPFRLPQVPTLDLRYSGELLKEIYDAIPAPTGEAQAQLSVLRPVPLNYRPHYRGVLRRLASRWSDDKIGAVYKITQSHFVVRAIEGRRTLGDRWRLRREGWLGVGRVPINWFPCVQTCITE